MRVIVCGGRDFEDRDGLFQAMDAVHKATPITMVVHGAARGADALAGEWAASRGMAVKASPADWKRYGRSAGPRRNQEMADAGADLCIAFAGGIGTADMCGRAAAAGIKVMRPT
jgi:hypothetical protein